VTESKTPQVKKIDLVAPIKTFFKEHFEKISSETLGWIAVLCLHGSTIPALLALMTGLTDNAPPIDIVLMVWTALVLLFGKAVVQKDFLNVITIGLGFVIQAGLMALIFFK
jgi:hypothetical protein